MYLPFKTVDDLTWSTTARHYHKGSPPRGADESTIALYGVASLLESIVEVVEVYRIRARQLSWLAHNWSFLSILFFRRFPESSGNVVFKGNTGADVRHVLAESIRGWRIWMGAYCDERYLDTLPSLLRWLDLAVLYDNQCFDGLYLRHVVEELFSTFHTMASTGGSTTRFAGISFTDEGTAFTLLAAMEKELLEETLVNDPYPHPRFLNWLTYNTIEGMNSLTKPPPRVTSRSPSSLSSNPTGDQSGPAPKGSHPDAICAWHAAGLLKVVDKAGILVECKPHFGTCRFPHVPLKNVTPEAIKTATENQMYAGAVMKGVLQAVEQL